MNRMGKSIKSAVAILSVVISASLAGCWGGGGDSIPSSVTTISGTAATGAAIAGVTITIKDKNGSSKTGTTGTDGKYSIDVSGMTAPFLMRVSSSNGYLYSVATATGTANIHPFTDLIIRNWYKVKSASVGANGDVETDFAGTGSLAFVPTASEINLVEVVVRNVMAEMFKKANVPPDFNLLTSSFTVGDTKFDAVLDNSKVNIDTATGTVTVTGTDSTTGIQGTVASLPLNTNLTAPDTTKPSDPSGLSVMPADTAKTVLVWTASTDNVGVAGYNIYRAGTKIGASPFPVYTDTVGLSASTQYCYKVEAFDGAGNISINKSGEACTTTLAAADTTKPSTPTGLTGGALNTGTQTKVVWTPSTDNVGVVGYQLYRNMIKIAGITSNGYSDNGLSVGTKYCYTVKAMDAAGNTSDPSSEYCVTTAATTPAIPTAISAAAGNGQATIVWFPASGATSYNIYWSTTSGVTKSSGTKITGATSPYTHTARTNGTTYYYIVTAANSSGESVESAQASATPSTSAGTLTNPLIGTWSALTYKGVTLPSGATSTWVLNADLTWSDTYQTSPSVTYFYMGTYTVSGNTVTFVPADSSWNLGNAKTGTYSISGNNMAISWDTGQTDSFQK